ncbi:MAG: ankyrin repeat domain-containing protein [Candidatus Micrarchaeota archaeon]|nr:ankyrin repeat domain-containing protein [Candidatus Micrarchaeota archaeon]
MAKEDAAASREQQAAREKEKTEQKVFTPKPDENASSLLKRIENETGMKPISFPNLTEKDIRNINSIVISRKIDEGATLSINWKKPPFKTDVMPMEVLSESYYINDLEKRESQIAQINKDCKHATSQKAIEGAAKYANLLASEMLVGLTPYICMRYPRFDDVSEKANKSRKDFNQLRDAQNCIAYSQMFSLYNMKAEVKGKIEYVASVKKGLNEQYDKLVNYDTSGFWSLSEYKNIANEFSRNLAGYSSKQMGSFEYMKGIKEETDLFGKIDLATRPYFEASKPIIAAGAMMLGPEGFAIGAVYFGMQAKTAFEERRYVEGALIAIPLTGPIFRGLRAISAAGTAMERVAVTGEIASGGAGLALQAQMAGSAAAIISSAAQQGLTQQDIAELMTLIGFAAMPIAGKNAEIGFVPEKVASEVAKPELEAKVPAAAKAAQTGNIPSVAVKRKPVALTKEAYTRAGRNVGIILEGLKTARLTGPTTEERKSLNEIPIVQTSVVRIEETPKSKGQPKLNEDLLMAAREGNNDKIEQLLKDGANIKARKDYTGSTTLILAVKGGRIETCKLLIEKVAEKEKEKNVKNFIDMKDKNGKTALMYAIENKQTDIAKFLKERSHKQESQVSAATETTTTEYEEPLILNEKYIMNNINEGASIYENLKEISMQRKVVMTRDVYNKIKNIIPKNDNEGNMILKALEDIEKSNESKFIRIVESKEGTKITKKPEELQPQPKEQQAFKNVLEAIEEIKMKYPQTNPETKIVITDKALKGAKESEFEDTRSVYNALEWLATDYIKMEKGNKKDIEASCLKKCGMQYRGDQNEKDIKMYYEDYHVTYEGKEYTLGKHLRKGTGSEDRYKIRIGFAYDSEKNKVIVGTIMPHPRTVNKF